MASPLDEVARSARTAILCTWVHDAIEAYCDAALLLGHAGERERLVRANDTAIWTGLLEPAYDALARRYACEVNDGCQGLLFSPCPEIDLQRQWARFAVGAMRQRGAAPLQRRILQATLGLAGEIDRITAANLLVGHVLDAPLPHA